MWSVTRECELRREEQFLAGFRGVRAECLFKPKEPETKDRKSEDVVKSAEQATMLMLVY
jgi:hypothetical protein